MVVERVLSPAQVDDLVAAGRSQRSPQHGYPDGDDIRR
jgi:hypothetical protein